jgi:hypothetical protein
VHRLSLTCGLALLPATTADNRQIVYHLLHNTFHHNPPVRQP